MKTNVLTNFYSSINRDVIDFESNPIDISEIFEICKEYSSLGFQIQNEIDFILENGFEEAIKKKKINNYNFHIMKDFFSKISKMYYLGDAAIQAEDFIKEIDSYELKVKRVNVN